METIDQIKLDDFTFNLKKVKYRNKIQELKLEHCTDDKGSYIYLALILIKKSQRGLGYGSAIMSDIIQCANVHNVRVKLSLSNMFGSDLKRLLEFYKKQGFIHISEVLDKELVYLPRKIRKY